MSKDELLNIIKEKIADKISEIEERSDRRIYISVNPDHCVEVNRFLFEDCGGRLATATGMDSEDALEVLYHFCFDHQHCVVTVKTKLDKSSPSLASTAAVIPGAQWIEREIHDLLGIEFEGHPDMRRLILADDWPKGVYPLRREYKKETKENNK